MERAAEQRVAVVTGCGKRIGIGSAAARALAAAGNAVIVTDAAPAGLSNDNEDADSAQWRGLASLVDEITAAGGKATAVQCDVTSETDCRDAVSAALNTFGRVDILVNNAGAPHGRDRADLEEVPLEAWERVMAVNARGVFLMSKAVLPHMRRQHWGRMINIASSAVKYPLRHRAAYSASKAAVVGFTQSLAVDLARSGITVNAICPGSIRTTRAMSTARLTGWADVEAGLAERAKSIPMGRHGSTEDVANLIAFLASEASGYITGQSIFVDGGGVPQT